jgi:hypothetical protein
MLTPNRRTPGVESTCRRRATAARAISGAVSTVDGNVYERVMVEKS